MRTRMGWFFTILLVTFLFIQAAFATNIDKIIVFGDSLSDNGNLYSKTFSYLPKSPPYYEGRFTNGPVWVENLAVMMNVPLEDYAFGGSWVEDIFKSGRPFPSLSNQIDIDYKLSSGLYDRNNRKHLYIIWAGANDYMNTHDDPEQVTTEVISIIKSGIDSLIKLGAENILLITLPDLSLVPGVIAEGEDYAKRAKILVDAHNEKLAEMLEQARIQHPNVKFFLVDISESFRDMMAHPDKYQLKNISYSCYGGGFYLSPQQLAMNRQDDIAESLHLKNNLALRLTYQAGESARLGAFSCDDPDDYFYWDGVHPTRVVHQIIANVGLKVLNDNGIFGAIG